MKPPITNIWSIIVGIIDTSFWNSEIIQEIVINTSISDTRDI